MQTIIDSLKWRYAVKQYDNTKKITGEQLDTLKEAVRLTPTSAGLQPFKLIVVETAEMKEKLAEASLFNRSQVLDSSHLFVFAAKKAITEQDIDGYIDLIVETRGGSRSDLEAFGTSMKGYLLGLSPEQAFSTTSKQTYIGLGILLSAAASMRVDATPMEGFDREEYDRILGLGDYSVSVICAVGHRAESDAFQHFKKVRKPGEHFFTTH
jgi:nitroreductase